MSKNIVWLVIVIVVGALLGSFLGELIGLLVPQGPVRDLFMHEISAGLYPATVNLQIIELTLGCVFKLNITAVIGIIGSALVLKSFSK